MGETMQRAARCLCGAGRFSWAVGITATYRSSMNLFHASTASWNGKGYPSGLAADEIPLMSRVLSVADAYDAMTSRRSYRESAFTSKQAIDEIVGNTGEQFDRAIVDVFIAEHKNICNGNGMGD